MLLSSVSITPIASFSHLTTVRRCGNSFVETLMAMAQLVSLRPAAMISIPHLAQNCVIPARFAQHTARH